MSSRLHNAVERQVQTHSQRLDIAASRFGRPSHFITRQQSRLALYQQNLLFAQRSGTFLAQGRLDLVGSRYKHAFQRATDRPKLRLGNAGMRLELLNPALVLKR